MWRPDLFGRVPFHEYSPPDATGLVIVSNGAGSRSDHFNGCVTSKPSRVTYWSQRPGCGAQALYLKLIAAPARRLVTGQSLRARL